LSFGSRDFETINSVTSLRAIAFKDVAVAADLTRMDLLNLKDFVPLRSTCSDINGLFDQADAKMMS
jgi:hypothetical protein